MKVVALERHLRLQGCVLKPEGGAHTIWENPRQSIVARHREIKEHLSRRIGKRLEIPQW